MKTGLAPEIQSLTFTKAALKFLVQVMTFNKEAACFIEVTRLKFDLRWMTFIP